MVIYVAQQHHAFVNVHRTVGFFKTNIINIILYGHIVYMYVSLLSEINDYYYYYYYSKILALVQGDFGKIFQKKKKIRVRPGPTHPLPY